MKEELKKSEAEKPEAVKTTIKEFIPITSKQNSMKKEEPKLEYINHVVEEQEKPAPRAPANTMIATKPVPKAPANTMAPTEVEKPKEGQKPRKTVSRDSHTTAPSIQSEVPSSRAPSSRRSKRKEISDFDEDEDRPIY